MIDKELKNKFDCMGCHACASICHQNCISMEADEEGFLYPIVDYDLCIKCNQCIYVCPIINQVEVENNPIAYACINKDESIRLDSSSGGIFSLVAEKVITQNGVVFGARFNNEFEVEHHFVETIEEIYQFRGSKYVQSKIGDSYKQAREFLDLGREVLFTGTPCQIAGLKSYLGKHYNNLFTIDIICHGVPSPQVWLTYVGFRETEAGTPAKKIAFRRKDEGWRRFSVSFLFDNNTEYRQNLRKDPYMRAFLKDVCLRPSCYDCNFKGLNRQSDITLADFWGVQNILSEMDDDKGTSLILVNSATGKGLLNEIKNRIIYQKVDIQEAVKYNSAAIKSSVPNINRNDFLRNLELLPFDKLVTRYCADKLSIKFKRKFRLIFGKVATKLGLIKVIKGLIR